MNLQDNKVFVQIGTNNGKDDFNLLCRKHTPSKVILVEPNSRLRDEIVENYQDIENVFITFSAITEKEGFVDLCIRPEMNLEGELKGIRYDGGYSALPLDDWGEELDVMTVPCMTFQSLCDKYGITDIHFLQIDTEGYDAEIIKSIDFNTVNIDIIRYEWWGFPEACFTKHKDKGVLCGDKGMEYVTDKLIFLGYELKRVDENVIAIKV